MKEIFGPEGLLSRVLPNFEIRPGQEEMSRAIGLTLEGKHVSAPQQAGLHQDRHYPQDNLPSAGILLVEAETGIGKTLAYLIPAVLSRQKIIVSTGTLNLQDQILNHEIPFIKRHLDPELNALCVKGRQNYLCLYRYKQFTRDQQQLFNTPDALNNLEEWLESTESGDRTELDWLPDNAAIWYQISATASQCLGSQCPDDASCFINRMRKKAAAARLLIVNHHLFFSDLALRIGGYGEVLPRYESVIFDEAHHLETVATTYFGTSFSHYQVLDLVGDIERLCRHEKIKEKTRTGLLQAASQLVNQLTLFSDFFPETKGRFPLTNVLTSNPQWPEGIQALASCLRRVEEHMRTLSLSSDIWETPVRRCEELISKLHAVTSPAMGQEDATADNTIHWYERRTKTISLHTSPIEIASIFNESIYNNIRSCIFTSATLTAGGRFTYFLDRLGLPSQTPSLSLTSPFDYKNRTLLYVPADKENDRFPPPGSKKFLEKTQQKIYDILILSKGRSLVLFTSIQAMRNVHDFLVGRLPYPLLLQGDAPKSVLLDTFQKRPESVLLAVASFWEGVNIPGESLSCVIIDKLPFEVPDDPIIMARLYKIKSEGGNPFFDFQIPRAILALRQGIGRLMRASTDRGLLAILDVRLFTKNYGRIFLNSLPPSPVTRDLFDIKSFFS